MEERETEVESGEEMVQEAEVAQEPGEAVLGAAENGGHPMIQWHPAFVAALEMEFRENSGDLLFEREYNLSRKPLQIDCLIIKKHDGAVLRNEIGKLFLRHNVVEYKSPRDGLTIDDLAMTQAYAYLYKAHGRRVNEIKLSEISVTLVREAAPEGLFKELEEGGCAVRRAYDGIYYVEDGVQFPTQIVVGRELKSEGHEWLRLLTDRATRQEMSRAFHYARGASEKWERELADAVLEVSARANANIVMELAREDKVVYNELLELFQPEIDKQMRETAERVEKETTERVGKETEKRDIAATIKIARRFGGGDTEIREELMRAYNLTEEEAVAYLGSGV